MKIYEMVFSMVASEDVLMGMWPGVYTMAWIYNAVIGDSYLDMHKRSGGLAPMFISPPYIDDGGGIRILRGKIPSGEVFNVRFTYASEEPLPILMPSTVKLGSGTASMVKTVVSEIDPVKLFDKTDISIDEDIRVRFVTPGIFTKPRKYVAGDVVVSRMRKVTTPFPDPARFLSSASRLVRTVLGMDTDLSRVAEDGGFYITNYRGRSSGVLINNTKHIGFLGTVSFRLSRDASKYRDNIKRALVLSTKLGVGSHRTYGCGWIIINDMNKN